MIYTYYDWKLGRVSCPKELLPYRGSYPRSGCEFYCETKEEVLEAMKKSKHDMYLFGEVNISFSSDYADFVSISPSGHLRCYNIVMPEESKVTIPENRWCGHYNYIVIPNVFGKKLPQIEIITPDDSLVGTITMCTDNKGAIRHTVIKNPKKYNLSKTEHAVLFDKIFSLLSEEKQYRLIERIEKNKNNIYLPHKNLNYKE